MDIKTSLHLVVGVHVRRKESDQVQVQLMIRCHIPGLEPDEINCLKYCFDLFDSKKQDLLSAWTILRAMGFRPSK